MATAGGAAYSQNMQLWTELDRPDPEKFHAWVEMLSTLHDGANNRVNAETSFTQLRRPLNQATVALVSTAGVHVDDQVPFDVSSTAGDPSFRLIPDDVDQDRASAGEDTVNGADKTEMLGFETVDTQDDTPEARPTEEEKEDPAVGGHRRVVQVMVFYDDDTFTSYRPNH